MKQMAKLAGLALFLATATAPVPVLAQTKTEWDGLLRVKAKKMDAVYLLPQADFRGYTKVMLPPTEISFRKNWQRDQNSSAMGVSRRVSDEDARKILDGARDAFQDVFRKAYEAAGFQVVDAPGPDVLRVNTAVINLDVEAPDLMTAGRSRTYSREAGGATLVIEAVDSVSGSVLGRAVDATSTGDMGPYLRNRATNYAEFERMFSDWARASANALNELKELSPIDAAGRLAKK